MKAIFLCLNALLVAVLLGGCASVNDQANMAWDAYNNKHDYDETIKIAKSCTESDPGFASCWYWLGEGLYQKGQYSEAINAFSKMLPLSQREPQYSAALVSLGCAYYSIGSYDHAIQTLDRAMVLDGAKTRANGFGCRGESYYMKGKIAKALKDMDKALELNPGFGDTRNFRGWARYFDGDFNGAIQDFDAAKPIFRNMSNKAWLRAALRGEAFSYLGNGDSETALRLINEAKAAYDYDANGDLFLIYYLAGNKEQASKYRSGYIAVSLAESTMGAAKAVKVAALVKGGAADKAGVLQDDIIVALNGSATTGVGQFIASIRSLPPGATAKLDLLRGGSPKVVMVRVGSTEDFVAKNHDYAPVMEVVRFNEAVRAFQAGSVKPALPEEAHKYRVQADVAINDKQFEDAADLYGSALAIAPWWPEGHYNRAAVLVENGNYSGAVREMKRYLALAPNAPDARVAQDKIYEWERRAGK